MIKDELYRRSPLEGTPIRMCESTEEEALIVKSIHERRGGVHQGSKNLTKQIEARAFLAKLSKECRRNSKHLDCKKHRNVQRVPSTMLSTMTSLVPFARWGLDIVGLLLQGSKNRKFIFVAVDYFTKWEEVEPTTSMSSKMAIDFVLKNIGCCFGTPLQIIIVNNIQFVSKE